MSFYVSVSATADVCELGPLFSEGQVPSGVVIYDDEFAAAMGELASSD